MLPSNRMKVRRTNIWCKGVILSLLATGFFIVSTAAESVNYNFQAPTVEKTGKKISPKTAIVQIDETEYSLIHLPEALSHAEKAGQPILPVKTVKILLPYGHEISSIKVTPGEKETLKGAYLIEYQNLPSYSNSVQKDVGPDQKIYTSKNPFPGKLYKLVSTQHKSGACIAIINLYPVQYIPASGKVTFYRSMKLDVQTTPRKSKIDQGSLGPYAISEVMARVDNPATIETYPDVNLNDDMKIDIIKELDVIYQYVIITTSNLSASFQSLADHKSRRGLYSRVVTTSYIYSNFTGNRPSGGSDNQTRIREFIQYAHTNWGTQYILLGGDDSLIPHRGCRGFVNSSSGAVSDNDIPCDLYYGCLDGTWDNDADGIYGESNDGIGGAEIDLMSEVYVGRAPVNAITETNNFVNKTISFETSFRPRHALMSGTQLNASTWGGTHKDEVAALFPGGWNIDRLYDRTGTCNTASITAAINSDSLVLWNSAGHGNTNSFSHISRANVDALTNNRYPFIYTWACYTASFDNRLPNGTYESNDCIAEHFVRNANGAFAYVGNSRYGWYSSGSTNGTSQKFDKSFFDVLFNDNIINQGMTLASSKEDLIGIVGSTGSARWVYFCLNLLGDPETPLDDQPVCYNNLPAPRIYLESTESYTTPSGEFIRYRIPVINRASFPNDLFAPAPSLPPCGLNPNASRTWVDIYNQNNIRLYGFCGLGTSASLANLWFAVRKGSTPPSSVYIRMRDRACNTVYTSGSIILQRNAPLPAFSSTFSSPTLSRGFWFTAPTDFVITGLQVPDEAGAGQQNVEVVKFSSGVTPPTYSSTTNSFVSLYRSTGTSSSNMLNVWIPVAAGEVIGILGAAGNTSMMRNSYGAGNYTSSIFGSSVVFRRLGMQYNLAGTTARNLWTSSGSIGRIMIRYTK